MSAEVEEAVQHAHALGVRQLGEEGDEAPFLLRARGHVILRPAAKNDGGQRPVG
ncbi:hypothetical protein [Propioniciclava flava]